MNVQQYFRVLKTIPPIGCVEPTVTTTAEYTALRAKASSLGYTLPSSTQDAINNRIIFYLKYTNQWDKLDLFYFFEQEAGLADFCTLNWKDPDNFQLYQPNPSLKPDFTAGQGFSGGGTKFWYTDYIPRTNRINLSINNAQAMYKIWGIPSTFSVVDYIAGCRNANDNGQIFISNNASGSMLHRLYNTTANTVTQSAQNGAYLNAISDLANWPSFTNAGRVLKDKTVPIGGISRATNLAESTATNFELTLLGVNISGTVTATGSSGLGYFSLGQALYPAELTTLDEYYEWIRQWFDILNGTYLYCTA